MKKLLYVGLIAFATLSLPSCGENKTAETADSTASVATDAIDSTASAASDAVDSTADAAAQAVDSTASAVKDSTHK